jgi:hypothetical protein
MTGEAPKTFNQTGEKTELEYKLEFNGFVCPNDFVAEFTPLEFEEVCLLCLHASCLYIYSFYVCPAPHAFIPCIIASTRNPFTVSVSMSVSMSVPGVSVSDLCLSTMLQLVQMYCDYDTDNSGTIDIYEVQKILFTMGIQDFEKKAVELMEIVDVDGSGEIDFEEFCRFIILMKKGEGAFAEYNKLLDMMSETPLGMLEAQAKVRNLTMKFQVIEEREATASNPPLYVVELHITGMWHEIVNGAPVSKLETKRYQGMSTTSREAKFKAASLAINKFKSFMPGVEFAEGDFPEEWVHWVDENLMRGVSASQIMDILVRKGFHPHKNLEVMQKCSISLSYDRFVAKYPDFDMTSRDMSLSFKRWIASQVEKGIDGNVVVKLLEDRNIFLRETNPHIAQQLMNNEVGLLNDSNGQQARILDFWHACSMGYVEDVSLYALCPIAVDKEKMGRHDSLARTGLQLAAAGNHPAVLHILIGLGADVNHKDRRNRTPLHLAAENNSRDACSVLIDHHGRIFDKDHQGNTALHLAAAKNHVEAVDLLANLGQNMTRSIVSDKLTVLEGVTFNQLGEQVYDEMQTMKLRPNEPRRFEKIWLAEAANFFISKMDPGRKHLLGPVSQEIMRDVLLRFDHRPDSGIMATPTVQDKKNKSSNITAGGLIFIPIINNTRELCDLLRYCFRQSSLDSCNGWGRTALHTACDMNHIQSREPVITLLVEKYGSNVYLKDRHGHTPYALLILERPNIADYPSATSQRENWLFESRAEKIEEMALHFNDEDMKVVEKRRQDFLDVCINKAQNLSQKLWMVTKDASKLANTYQDWEQYSDPDTLNSFYCRKPDEDSYTGLHTDYTWTIPKVIKPLIDRSISWVIHRAARATELRCIYDWIHYRDMKSKVEFYFNMVTSCFQFKCPKELLFVHLKEKSTLVEKLGFGGEWYHFRFNDNHDIHFYFNNHTKVYAWDPPLDAVTVLPSQRFCTAYKDKGKRVEQRWYTCEECNQAWKVAQDNPKAKIMIKICEPCSYRCHRGHKGVRFIRSSVVVCMCLSTCRAFCECKAQDVSAEQLAISQEAYDERLELRRRRLQEAIMPPVFAMVPRFDLEGCFKRESGWMICRRAPLERISKLVGHSNDDNSSVTTENTDTTCDSSQEHYSESVVGELFSGSKSMLLEENSARLAEIEAEAAELEGSTDKGKWVAVLDPENPNVIPIGTRVLCKRKKVFQKCYGVVYKHSGSGINVVKFAFGETEPIHRENIDLVTRNVFLFNETTGQSYWHPGGNSLSNLSNLSVNNAKSDHSTSASMLEDSQISQFESVDNLNEASFLPSVPEETDYPPSPGEEDDRTNADLPQASSGSQAKPPLVIHESMSLCMSYQDWDTMRLVSNQRREFEEYVEYEDPTTLISFMVQERLASRELAAMTIQRFLRTKHLKAHPIYWVTTACTLDIPDEVYIEQQKLAGWAMLRRQSKLMGYFTDIDRVEWEEYMDPESSNFFYWQEEDNIYQWNRPEIPVRQMKKDSVPLLEGEEVRYTFSKQRDDCRAVVVKCRIDDETGGDCYDVCMYDKPIVIEKWIPRFKIKKAVLVGNALKLAMAEEEWKKLIKKQRDKESRNRLKVKAQRIAEETKKRSKFLAARMLAHEKAKNAPAAAAATAANIDNASDAGKPSDGTNTQSGTSASGTMGAESSIGGDSMARARIRRCKQEEDEIQDEKDKEYLESRKKGVQKMMNETIAQNINFTRTELLNLQRALTLKLTLEDKLKARAQAQKELIAKREKVVWRRKFLEDSLRPMDIRMTSPKSIARRKILRNLHIAMKRQIDGYITCEWGCNDWVRAGQEQQDHQLRGCTKRIVGCVLGCPLKCPEDEWLEPHQNHEGLDEDLAAEFAKYNKERPKQVPYQQYHEENECPKRLKPCPRKCLEWATFEDMPKHMDYYCVKRPAQPIMCRLGCEKMFGGLVEQLIEAEDERLNHEQEECEFRMVRCNWKNYDGSMCAAQIKCTERDSHRDEHIQKMGIYTYSVAGTYIFKVPRGIFRLKMQVWGAGGGSGHFKGRGGGSGGGGAFVEVLMHVSPHDVLEVVVGAAGQAGVHGTEIEALETTEKVEGRFVDPAARSFDVIDASYGTSLGGLPGGGEGYGGGGNWAAGGGGGYSMVAKRHAGGNVALVLAAGGGGGSSNSGIPGAGMEGPLPGTKIDVRNGQIGTIYAGGAAGDSGSIHNSLWPATEGVAWTGGNGSQYGGGGGGGYFGGGGGGTVPGVGGGGGGGASYILTENCVDYLIIQGEKYEPGGILDHEPPEAVGVGEWDKVGGPAGQGGIGDLHMTCPGNTGAVRILKPGFFNE